MDSNPMLAGNLVSLPAPCIFIPIFSFISGLRTPKYDWLSVKLIRKGDDSDLAAAASMDLELVPGESRQSDHDERMEKHQLQRAAKIARSLTLFLTIALLILWPFPMYGSKYIFSKKFFTGWVSVGILWLFCSSFCVGLYPLWEGRHTSSRTVKAIFLDIIGKRKPVMQGRASIAETADAEEKANEKNGVDTPPVEAVDWEGLSAVRTDIVEKVDCRSAFAAQFTRLRIALGAYDTITGRAFVRTATYAMSSSATAPSL